MDLAVTDTKAISTELVRRAEAGEVIVPTRHGQAVALIVALRAQQSAERRAEIIAQARAGAAARLAAGASAARSQDFLCDDDGLPQ